MTSDPSPILYYNYEQELPGMWDAELYMAVAHTLGAYLVQPLTGKTSLQRLALLKANEIIDSARVSAANEDFMLYENSYGTDSLSQPFYVYPLGPYVSVGTNAQ